MNISDRFLLKLINPQQYDPENISDSVRAFLLVLILLLNSTLLRVAGWSGGE
jgi:hypothetical protein